MKAAEKGNPPNRGNQVTAPKPAKTHSTENNITANRYERGEVFRRFHHQNADEIDSAGDNLSVESDNKANPRN